MLGRYSIRDRRNLGASEPALSHRPTINDVMALLTTCQHALPSYRWDAPAHLRQLVNEGAPHVADEALIHSGGAVVSATELKDALHDGDFGPGRIEAAKGSPIVHNHTAAEHVAPAIHGTSYQRNLEERGQLFDIFEGRPGMDHPSLIGELGI